MTDTLHSHPLWRLPFLAAGLLILLVGLGGGLLRLGWSVPAVGAGAAAFHGPIMIGGFLGTLISLERAVALGRPWPYLGPAAAALGGLALLLGLPVIVGQILLLLASGVLVFVFVEIIARQMEMFTVTMGLGALAWLVAQGLWIAGWSIPAAVPWWMAFLVLTIVGERLELSRFLPRTPDRQINFMLAAGLYSVGVVGGLFWPSMGWAVAGLGMIGMALWLVVYDLARMTVRQRGMTRFVAVCLLSGYFWLAIGGGLAVYHTTVSPLLASDGAAWPVAAPVAGPIYDAILHAVLLGFVFAMIFGHALIIFPAVLGVRMDYRPRFYAHLVLLQASVALRVASDLAGWWSWRQWAGMLSAAAIVLFLMQTVSTLRRRGTTGPGKPLPPPTPPGPTGRTIRLGVGSVERDATVKGLRSAR